MTPENTPVIFKIKNMKTPLLRKLIVKPAGYCVLLFVLFANIAGAQQSTCSAAFNYTPDSTGYGVYFQDASTGNSPTYWHWDFGDGDTSSQPNPYHVYNVNAGTYNVCLYISDSATGCFSSFCDSVYFGTGVISNCQAYFSATVDTSGMTFFFNGYFSSNYTNATIWSWDFGDGSTDTVQNPVHTYASPGTYYVTLSASDSSGCTGTWTSPVTTGAYTTGGGGNNKYVQIYYAFDSLGGPTCPTPVSVGFFMYGTAVGYNSADTLTLEVNFGDGTSSTSLIPVGLNGGMNGYIYGGINHTYTAAGQYSVQYILTAPDSSADTLVNYNEVIVGDTCGNISGTVYVDSNGDCVFNAGDIALPWEGVELLDNNGQSIAWSMTDSSGNYYFSVPNNASYIVSCGGYFYNYNNYTVTCPSGGTYNVSTFPSSGNDFGWSCPSGFDLEGSLSGWGFRPGDTAYAWIDVWNNRCLPVNGTVTLVLDSNVTYIASPYSSNAPSSVNGDTLVWNFSSMGGTMSWNAFWSYIELVTDTNVAIGDSVCFTLIVDPVTGDSVPANNTVYVCFPVSNSWDPNMKTVSPRGAGLNGAVLPGPFTYNVYFQNTGNAPAYNIYVLDTIDSDLDINSFHVISSSHSMSTDILPGNVLRFNFKNIMLPDSLSNEPASHGLVTYTINPKNNLQQGTQLTNTAYIYFDFNPAVVTNTVVNTIDYTLSVPDATKKNLKSQIILYPNPARDEVMLTGIGGQGMRIFMLTDMMGKTVMKGELPSGKVKLNLKHIPDGLYTIFVMSEEGVIRSKLVVVH